MRASEYPRLLDINNDWAGQILSSLLDDLGSYYIVKVFLFSFRVLYEWRYRDGKFESGNYTEIYRILRNVVHVLLFSIIRGADNGSFTSITLKEIVNNISSVSITSLSRIYVWIVFTLDTYAL